jgi:2-methylisocitrate lyase-like PEP mutase family enzyme
VGDTAGIFRGLHINTTPLRLPNAWDAGSARLFESLGAAAIATTSAGLAWSLGFRDGRNLRSDELIASAARMMRVLTVPLSVDIENGYSDEPKLVAEFVKRLIDLGVAGINIEDGTDPPSVLAAKIEAIRSTSSIAGADLFINARCDVFLAKLVDDSMRVKESLARAALYARAGSDGLFLPGIVQPADLKLVAETVSLPLNAMAWPGLPEAGELGKLGVRRLSAGSGIAQVLWHQAATLAKEFLQQGRSEDLFETAMAYPKLQELFPK